MYIEGFEQWFKLNRNLTTPFTDLNKATTELCRLLAQENLEIIEENFSRWSDQVKRLSSVRKPEDLIHLQKECIHENVQASIGNIQKLVQISLKNFEEFSKIYGTTQATDPYHFSKAVVKHKNQVKHHIKHKAKRKHR
jgi:hypothetical protein